VPERKVASSEAYEKNYAGNQTVRITEVFVVLAPIAQKIDAPCRNNNRGDRVKKGVSLSADSFFDLAEAIPF
jgi:hypothetical protein